MHNSARQWLEKLVENGSLRVSSVPRVAQLDIHRILDINFIKWEKSGAGARYILVEKEAIQNLLKDTGYHGDLDELTAKAKAVALHGDAHKGQDETLLLLFSAAGRAEWSDGDNTLNVADYVSRFGIASMAVRPGDQWYTNQPVALVENIDLVLYASKYFEKEEVDFQGSIIYYSGWLSIPFLDWLTEIRRAPSYVLFADYDLVGIKNYLLAKKRLGKSISMYVPDNIEELLKYGKTLDTQSDRQMIESSEDPDVIRLYRLMLETNRVLDQESILLM